MITKLLIMPEYGCYPVWLIDDREGIIDTRLPEELRSDLALDAKFESLYERFNALYINNQHEFSYAGFRTKEEAIAFIRDWKLAVAELREKTHGRYEIVDDLENADPDRDEWLSVPPV